MTQFDPIPLADSCTAIFILATKTHIQTFPNFHSGYEVNEFLHRTGPMSRSGDMLTTSPGRRDINNRLIIDTEMAAHLVQTLDWTNSACSFPREASDGASNAPVFVLISPVK